MEAEGDSHCVSVLGYGDEQNCHLGNHVWPHFIVSITGLVLEHSYMSGHVTW
jgi:hypothetical protein